MFDTTWVRIYFNVRKFRTLLLKDYLNSSRKLKVKVIAHWIQNFRMRFFVFPILSYQNACYGCENAEIEPDPIFFFWRTKVSEAACKRDWHNVRSYLFFKARKFRTQCAETFSVNLNSSHKRPLFAHYSDCVSCSVFDKHNKFSSFGLASHLDVPDYHALAVGVQEVVPFGVSAQDLGHAPFILGRLANTLSAGRENSS